MVFFLIKKLGGGGEGFYGEHIGIQGGCQTSPCLHTTSTMHIHGLKKKLRIDVQIKVVLL